MSCLTLYKASAGSGKTYQITAELLKIIIPRPESFKHILAVTFTNKATAEMKERLINELHNIYKGAHSDHLTRLQQSTGLSISEISANAGKALKQILNNYSALQITTLDSFFQSIIRQLVYELGISHHSRIEVKSEGIINQAIENLLLSANDNAELMRYLVELTLSEVREGRSWDLRKSLKLLGYESIKEHFRLRYDPQPHLFDREHVRAYQDSLVSIIREFEVKVRQFGQKGIATIQNNGLCVDDFYQKKRGPAGYLQKLCELKSIEPGTYVLNALDHSDNWCNKKHPRRSLIVELSETELMPLLHEAIAYITPNLRKYNTATEVMKSLFRTGLVRDIRNEMLKELNEQNIFLLSEGGYLLKALMTDNDSPFLYEKAGNWFNHIFVDEFQDTSLIQYQNLRPLMLETVSRGNSCILVGDAKQSIYRWRNSDWNIFVRQVAADFANWNPAEVILPYNWRSAENIVWFNNTLYSLAPGLVGSKAARDEVPDGDDKFGNLRAIYTDATQNVSPANLLNPGSIGLWFLKKSSEQDFSLCLEDFLFQTLTEYQARGISAGRTAILVRRRTEAGMTAQALQKLQQLYPQQFNFHFRASDSFPMMGSSTIRLLISSLQFINSPTELLYRESLRVELLDREQWTDEDIFFLLKELENARTDLCRKPLYELCDHIIRNLRLEDETDQVYLLSFLQHIYDFAQNRVATLSGFLAWWEEEQYNLNLEAAGESDAIRILTIHQSKGLEFDAVLIPFCTWRFEPGGKNAPLLWCQSQVSPFDEVSVNAVKYSKRLSDTFFQDDYFTEKANQYTDALNLLYVATTRARQALSVLAEQPAIKNDGSLSLTNTGHLIYACLENGLNRMILAEENDVFVRYIVGSILPNPESSQGIVHDTIKANFLPGRNTPLQLRVNYRLTEKESSSWQLARFGNTMHYLVSQIALPLSTPKSILNKAIANGTIPASESQIYLDALKQLMENPQLSQWFTASGNILSEQDILIPGKGNLRPDRLYFENSKAAIIDFKFGNSRPDAHREQIKEYCQILEQMGYTAEGYLYYFTNDELLKINVAGNP